MGTNYFRIPSELEREVIKNKLMEDMTPTLERFSSGVFTSQMLSEIDSYVKDFIAISKIHIGKKSVGWNFIFNFNEGKYYNNTRELAEFVKSGMIVNENDEVISSEDFLNIALNQNSSFKRQRNYDQTCFIIDGYDFLDSYFR